ncbi:MAG: pilus assembly protein PilP [Xanthomonadales bacterium]
MNNMCHLNTLKVVALISLLTLLAACDNKQDDLGRYIAEVKARPATPIPPIPSVRTYTPYVYNGLQGRDPFRSSTSEGSDEEVGEVRGSGPHPDFQRTREYLERYELDTLMMVGTFAKGSSDWVLIRDPDGTIHRVSTGNYMGKNHGKVSIISSDEVELSEFIADGAGGWLVRDASLTLGGS